MLARWWMVFASLFFYGYWDVTYVPLLLLSIGWNYLLGQLIARGKWRKGMLVFAVLGNLALLGYYKYAGFFVTTLNDAAGFAYDVPQIILPLGIALFSMGLFKKVCVVFNLYFP